jgi:hypothetical protein
VFDNAEDFMATAGALLRTGLMVATVPPATYGGANGFIHRPTRLLIRLSELANIEGVVCRNGVTDGL